MYSPNTRYRRLLKFEGLESRRLLAGDVTVSVNNAGDLIIRGDTLDNYLQVEAGLLPGQYTVTGLPDDQSNPTTVNGQGSMTVSGVIGDINVQLRAGNDWLEMGTNTSITLAGDLKISTDDGDDFVHVEDTTVGGVVAIISGDGNDVFHLLRSTVVGDVGIHSGDGSDSISLEHVDVINGNVEIRTGAMIDDVFIMQVSLNHDLHVGMGGEIDSLTMQGKTVFDSETEAFSPDGSVTVGGAFTVNMGPSGGNLTANFANIIGDVTVRGSDGPDTVSFSDSSTLHGNVSIRTGIGDDTISFSDSSLLAGVQIFTGAEADNVVFFNSSVSGNAEISTGAGVDGVFLLATHFGGTLTVETGADNDTVDSEGSVYDDAVAILLGNGDDVLILLDSAFGDDVLLDGGRGTDTLTDLGGNAFAVSPDIQRFEA